MADFPYRSMDKRPRKRPRLTWDLPPTVPPAPPKVQFSDVFSFLKFARALNELFMDCFPVC